MLKKMGKWKIEVEFIDPEELVLGTEKYDNPAIRNIIKDMFKNHICRFRICKIRRIK